MWSGPRSLSVSVIALTEKQPGSHVLLACQDGPDTPSVASQAPRPRPPTETAAVLAESVPPAGLAVLPPVASPSSDLPCTGDPELFFTESPGDAETAKALCRKCPARAACLVGALERREPWGVWGGELFLHGTIVPRKRPRGRPRKTDVAA
jgi:WhiB family redox-sensing transcriptional regulator